MQSNYQIHKNTAFISVTLFLLTFLFMNTAKAGDWWLNPPEDTPDYIYGLGEGFGMQQARQAALSDIAGKLSTQLTSSLNRLVQESDGRFNESIRQEINSQTTDVELSQFQVIQSYQTRNNVTRVLVRLERQRLAAIWQQRIAEHHQRILPVLEYGKVDNTRRWREAYMALPYALEARNLSYQLFALTGEPTGPDIYQAVNQLLNNHSVSIGVLGNSESINQAIESSLRQLGISVCQSSCTSVITYSQRNEQNTAFGEHIARIFLQLDLKEGKQQQNRIEITTQAVSMSNHSTALRSAARQLNTQIATRLVELLKT